MSPAQAFHFILDRFRSIRCAAKGVFTMVRLEHNAWLHTLATGLVIAAGFFFGLTRWEWCWLILAMIAVWTAEALNTAFEFLTDLASPEFHPLAEKAKDVAAGAVLIAAGGSVAIGAIVFVPHLLAWLR